MKSSCLKKQARVPGGETGLVGALVLGGEKAQFISFIETGPALFSSADSAEQQKWKCAKQINPSEHFHSSEHFRFSEHDYEEMFSLTINIHPVRCTN